MHREFEFIIGIHADLSAAGGDYEAVHRACEDHREAAFDAAVLARKGDGTERIYRHSAPSGQTPAAVTGVWGLSTGLAVALFPAIWIGSGPATPASSTTIGAIATSVSQGLGRDALKEVGELLDGAAAALIVATAQTGLEAVRSAISHADSVLSKPAVIDRENIGAILTAGGAGPAPGSKER